MKDILEFKGENRWLSNFWPCTIKLDTDFYHSVEHAYVAAKTIHSHERLAVRFAKTAGDAKRMGRSITIRENWDNLKLNYMHGFIEQKFSEGSELAGKLIATGSCLIVEGNTWGDRFWGVCGGEGANNLGVLIMDRRKYLTEALRIE